MAGIFDALIQQESGGRPGVMGPKTKWGRALGLTQMLPATAQEMARKLGVPWQPELMTAKDQSGAAYQRQLGEAYFNEGLQKTGNERDALRYYHGGPNRQQWGPKTNAYADQVLARAGGDPMIRPRKPRLPGQAVQPQMAAAPLNDAPVFGGMTPEQMNPGIAPAGQFAQAPQLPPSKGGKGMKTLGTIAGILGDAMSAYGGQRGVYAPFMAQQMENEAQENRWQQQLAAKTEADRQARYEAASKPIRFQNNSGDQVEVDPRTGQPRILYADPAGKTEYARITDPTTGEISITPQGKTSRPTQGHIQLLMQSGDTENFDAKFGPGMADYYMRMMGNR